MTTGRTLAEIFLAAAGAPPDRASDELGQRLATTVEECRAAWPGVELDATGLVAFLGEKVRGEASPERALRVLRVTELCLTSACARGEPRALQAFEEHYLSGIGPALARLGVSADTMDETRQLLRQRLLVAAPDGAPPLIIQYSGRGPLQSWLTVAATRRTLNLLRDQGREVPTEAAALEPLLPAGDDPELRFLKEHYRQDFKAALDEALEALGSRELGVLQLHYAEGLTTRQIGALYRVHQTTAAQWLVKARKAFLRETRRALERRLAASASECESIIRLVQSQLDLTLRRFFAA